MQGIIIRLPKTWLNKVHKQKSASLFLLLIFIFIFLLSFSIWRKFADNCNRICFYYFYFYFDFVLCFRLFCALFSSRFALNCCCNAALCAGGSRQGERGEGGERAEGDMWVLFQFTTKWRSITIQCLKFLSRCGRQRHTQTNTQTLTHTHTYTHQATTNKSRRIECNSWTRRYPKVRWISIEIWRISLKLEKKNKFNLIQFPINEF